MSIEQGVSTSAPRSAQATTGAGVAKPLAGVTSTGSFASLLLGLGAEGEAVAAEVGLAGTELEGAALAPAEDDGAAVLVTEALPVLADVLPSVPALQPMPTPAPGGRQAAAEQIVLPQALNVNEKALVPAEATDAGQAAGEVQPLLKQAGLMQRMNQQRVRAAEIAEERQPIQQAEDLAARLGWQTSEATTPHGTLHALLAGAGLAESGWRPQERRSERGSVQAAGAADVGLYAGVAQAEGARLDILAVAPDGGLTTEMRVAEQVSYWVGRGAQSAEMEVEGIDERPIHVSITLQGQEARIEFRAEQVQTRQVLQDAMPHLREMLERQGLTLADVSVGTSGGGDGRGQPGRERPGARQAQVVLPEVPVAAHGARGPLPSGRSVDLFV